MAGDARASSRDRGGALSASYDRDPTLGEYLAACRALEPEQHTTVVRVGNTGATWRTLRLEPWATELPLPPG